MAVLSDALRRGVWSGIMRYISDVRETVSITKTELRAAIDAADTWLDTNASSYNSALPQPARGGTLYRAKGAHTGDSGVGAL